MNSNEEKTSDSERYLLSLYSALRIRGLHELVPLPEDSVDPKPLLLALDERLGHGWTIVISGDITVKPDQVVGFESQQGVVLLEEAEVITHFIHASGLYPAEVWGNVNWGEHLDSASLPKYLKDAVARRNRMVELAARK